MNFKRRNQSFLFINNVDRPDVPQGSLLIVKHAKKQVHVAEYQRIGTPLTEDQIAKDCNPASVSRPSVDVSKAELVNCKNWRRQDRTEHVGKWKSRVYEMHNAVVKFRECKLPAEAAELSSEAVKKQPKKAEEEAFKKNLRPMLWLTEQF
ncbi:uncharacterized protein LOC121804503 [Salvia splendens]|nr:uncharacterized protein LOC121804503 [Salvia splendens]